METTTELAELRKEVATLKQEMAELKRFLHIQRHPAKEPGTSAKMSLNISCSSLSLNDAMDERNMSKTLGGFWIEKGGPSFFLWGNDDRARAVLEVRDNKPALYLYNDDLKPAVVATLDKTDHAYVAVLDHGKPRAALKATEPGGIVTVTHDDGFARATMRAEAEHGTVSVINADMKTVGELNAKCALGSGGALLINTPVGKPSVVITSTPYSGFMAVHDAAGKLIATVPGSPEGTEEGGES